MLAPVSTTPSTTPSTVGSDVLHAENHTRLSVEDIAKAVARHQREHGNRGMKAAVTAQKTTPRK